MYKIPFHTGSIGGVYTKADKSKLFLTKRAVPFTFVLKAFTYKRTSRKDIKIVQPINMAVCG